MQIMTRYPAMGSPCPQPQPTLILGGWEAIYEDRRLKFLRREFIQWMYLGVRPNIFRLFSINLKDIQSKAFEKSICNMRPGRLLLFGCLEKVKCVPGYF